MDPSREKPILQGFRIMVVEDEWLIAMEVRNLLAKAGCTVLGPLNSAPRALASLDREVPDAAILDLNLRGEYPVHLVRALSTRAIPCVIVTGYGRSQVTAPEVRNFPQLSKPIDHDRLLQNLREILRIG